MPVSPSLGKIITPPLETKTDSAELRLLPDADETRAYDSGEPPRTESSPPTRIGRYLIVEELGRGGMGVVWTAYDPKLDRKVALKLLRTSSHTPTRKARFIREAQALARLNHPNIVTVHDVDTHDDQLYMAMEYVAGRTLEQWRHEGPDWRTILEVFGGAGQGLAAAHAADITHRDFKPSNVLIADDGRVKVLDFGLAKHMGRADESDDDDDDDDGEPPRVVALSGAHRPDRSDIMKVIESSPRGRLTKVGRVVGTPAYMAPEQYIPLGPHGVSAKTDQFSFAVSLYEALYGQLPFEGSDLFQICDEVRAGNVREPSRDSPVPGWVLRVLQRALRADPGQRYPSMTALLAALAADPARRRRRILAYAGGVGLLGLAAYGVVEAATNEAPAPVCQGASERVAEVWNDQTRASLEHGLIATDRPFAADTTRRVVAGLDDYTEAWARQHTAICEATRLHGEQSETLLDVRMTCLDRRRGELAALVDVLATAEEDTVAAAVAAVAGLRRPEPCASAQPGVQSDVPTEPTRRAEYLALQARLDDANALLAAGRYADARDRAAATRTSARTLGFGRIHGEALVAEGTALRQLREPEPARLRLREGVAMASEAGDGRTEFIGWVELLYVAGVMLDEPERAADWQFAAEGALRRLGSPRDMQLTLALNLSAAGMADIQRLEEAAGHAEQARQLGMELGEPLQQAQALNNLGIIAAKQADWILAEQRLRQGHELKAQTLGPDHPDVMSSGMNLANVLVQYAAGLDDTEQARAAYDEAEQLYARVVAFREQTDGPRSKSVARALSMQGLLQHNRGMLIEARQTYEHALQILKGLPSSGSEQISALTYLARIERKDGQLDRAMAYKEQLLALRVERYGDAHPTVVTIRLELCQLLDEAGEYDRAVSQCERVVSQLEALSDGDETVEQIDVPALLHEAKSAVERSRRALGSSEL